MVSIFVIMVIMIVVIIVIMIFVIIVIFVIGVFFGEYRGDEGIPVTSYENHHIIILKKLFLRK